MISQHQKTTEMFCCKKEVEEHLVEYCTLREYGFNFEKIVSNDL